jgi:Asp-tRNA(Asn)/Glu-tRNA(Gln) amidotransferase A subunit family amidase
MAKGKDKGTKSKNKGGRKPKYKPEYAEQAFKLCLLGATDKELADFFEVKESTINDWKKKRKEFSESIKNGKEKADAEVAKSLFKRATGYKQEVVKVFQFQGQPIIVPVTEEVAPDTGACMAWLKNRQKAKWRDKKDVDVNVIGKLEDLINE